MKKYTQKELKAQIVELSIDHHRAQLAVRRRRNELNDLYQAYFRAHGEPEPNHRGIRLGDPRYAGVIDYTNDACTALHKARQKRYSAKRRLDTAVSRLMILTGASFAVPDAPAVKRPALTLVRRSTACGETLQ
ncbi:hypothetical protein JBE38_13825 [Pseudomonas sp. ICBG1301]|uniref:hypothetical protein n=1 Tax=Pseudomonas sp. ICBG1301 TaxID=2795987 RepID=UPI000F8676FF|nr:hypothetical protein [Pseudomonas sp. ICBG1301]MBM9487005.1 hypothetical protein [Pseudomonas sp. ICBG1301]RUQ46233.1 hypothetical protein D8M30_14630 [Corynebacterium pseudodiphtheriticum]